MEFVGNHNPTECGPENHKHAAQFAVGEPRATPLFTVQQLKSMGYVGLYKPAEPAKE